MQQNIRENAIMESRRQQVLRIGLVICTVLMFFDSATRRNDIVQRERISRPPDLTVDTINNDAFSQRIKNVTMSLPQNPGGGRNITGMYRGSWKLQPDHREGE